MLPSGRISAASVFSCAASERFPFRIRQQSIQASSNVAQLKRHRRKPIWTSMHLFRRQRSAPLHRVFTRHFQRMQDRSLLGWKLRQGAAQPRFRLRFHFRGGWNFHHDTFCLTRPNEVYEDRSAKSFSKKSSNSANGIEPSNPSMLPSFAIFFAARIKPVHAVRANAEPTLTRRTPRAATSAIFRSRIRAHQHVHRLGADRLYNRLDVFG